MLFIDKYIPKKIEDIKYSNYSNEQLKSLIHHINFPHIILKGYVGSGKRLRALLFLKEKYGDTIFNLNTYKLEYKVPNKKDPLVLSIIYSPYHYQINLAPYGVYDRVLLDAFFKEIMSFRPLNKLPYNIIIIENAEKLSNEAQQALRRTLETKINNARFIFIVNYGDNIIDPLYSRCITIPIFSPTDIELYCILKSIAKKENLSITYDEWDKIIAASERNVKTAINILNKYTLDKTDYLLSELDIQIYRIYNLIIKCAKSKTKKIDYISDIRKIINVILNNSICELLLLKKIYNYLINNSQINKKQKIIYNITKLASKYDIYTRNVGKIIYPLEGFCIQVIEILMTGI